MEAPEPSKPVRPVAAVKPLQYQSKIDYGGALARVLERDSNATNAGDVPTPSNPPSRSQSLSSAGGFGQQATAGFAHSRVASLAGGGGSGGVIDLTRSATPSPNRSQGLSLSSTEGSRRGGGSNCLGFSDTDGASDNFGAVEAKKKFTFKSKLSKSSAPPKSKSCTPPKIKV